MATCSTMKAISSEKSVLSYEYDDTKHLIRTSVKEEKEPSVITDLTWKADNLTTATWLDGNILREDRARYQLGYYNSFNLDLNWLLLDSEGWEAAAGDPTKLFGLCRLTGKGSILLASEVSYYDEGHVKTMRYEFKNVNDEFFVILRYNDSNRLDREYTPLLPRLITFEKAREILRVQGQVDVFTVQPDFDILGQLATVSRSHTRRRVDKHHVDRVSVLVAAHRRRYHPRQRDILHRRKQYLNLRRDAHALVGELFMQRHYRLQRVYLLLTLRFISFCINA